MRDRGMIKWAPFNAVINGKEVIKEINNNKEKINKPILSEEQIMELEETIKYCYTSNTNVDIYYYYSGQEKIISGKITKIDSVNKKIMINNKISLYFANITRIIEKNA